MTARVLIVDDIAANIRLLRARLTAEYFDVLTADNGADALAVVNHGGCDIVLLDVLMPGMDGFEVCRRIKANPNSTYVPVIMITSLDQPADRLRGLEAGADDFLTHPVTDVALITRVKSLARLKMVTDELAMRIASGGAVGLAPPAVASTGENGSILLVDDREASSERLVRLLAGHHRVVLEADPHEALFKAAEGSFDIGMISLDLAGYDGLRLCSQLRSLDRTRLLPLLVLVQPGDDKRLLRGLDLGVNDYLLQPADRDEMLARVRTQVRRKRFSDHLRDSFQLTIEMAITDSLTGLHNRGYLERHLSALVDQAQQQVKPLSLLILDIDHFKDINDRFGHAAGDDVLREFSRRLKRAVRGIDLACRFGGEEFVVAMPDTDADLAFLAGERLRERIAGEAFVLADGTALTATASIGVCSLSAGGETPEALLRRADAALYQAKREGRNRVVAAAA